MHSAMRRKRFSVIAG
ncbi:unnamed protein product [Linum tenue]|uniref:Uncharacterized protein n=1 Tax=Linum tenue TaxID=586396 RepID=A0AAV0KCK4_9ROSI|nr:unnamed protein product [Linum tenue]CAI0429891.1 unnamed protein product [Linum tenue]CAI0465368.1 unnamed protein product [Linum tenue]CAI0551996.1 unnamed protein product [Linum tenue]